MKSSEPTQQVMPRPVPILVYHSVTDEPAGWIAPFAVSPKAFTSHLDQILAERMTAITVSDLVDARAGRTTLPDRPVVLTFDDGFADMLDVAAPALAERGLPATLYVTTGALRGGQAPSSTRMGPAEMLHWRDLSELQRLGIEIGSHTHTHPPLDVIPRAAAWDEIVSSRALLQDALGHRVRSFAYPHGVYNRRVAMMVEQAGYDSAVAVRNALSSTGDDPLILARLMLTANTPLSTVRAWLSGTGAPVAPFPVRLVTRAWRLRRRATEVRRAITIMGRMT